MTRLSLALLVLAGCGGSSSSLRISIADNAGSNVAPAPLDFPNPTGARDLGVGIFQFDAQDELAPERRRLVIVELHESANTALTAGRTFVVDRVTVGDDSVGHAAITLTDVEDASTFASWQAAGGSVTVSSVDGNGVRLHFDAAMSPAQFTSAAGSFHFAGDVSVDDIADTHFLSGSP